MLARVFCVFFRPDNLNFKIIESEDVAVNQNVTEKA